MSSNPALAYDTNPNKRRNTSRPRSSAPASSLDPSPTPSPAIAPDTANNEQAPTPSAAGLEPAVGLETTRAASRASAELSAMRDSAREARAGADISRRQGEDANRGVELGSAIGAQQKAGLDPVQSGSFQSPDERQRFEQGGGKVDYSNFLDPVARENRRRITDPLGLKDRPPAEVTTPDEYKAAAANMNLQFKYEPAAEQLNARTVSGEKGFDPADPADQALIDRLLETDAGIAKTLEYTNYRFDPETGGMVGEASQAVKARREQQDADRRTQTKVDLQEARRTGTTLESVRRSRAGQGTAQAQAAGSAPPAGSVFSGKLDKATAKFKKAAGDRDTEGMKSSGQAVYTAMREKKEGMFAEKPGKEDRALVQNHFNDYLNAGGHNIDVGTIPAYRDMMAKMRMSDAAYLMQNPTSVNAIELSRYLYEEVLDEDRYSFNDVSGFSTHLMRSYGVAFNAKRQGAKPPSEDE